jgi:predicted dehydrogenase
VAEVAAIADMSTDEALAAKALAPRARLHRSYESLLSEDLDGVVIATPSALHARQAIVALERGRAVFCQKPLGRNAEETRRVVEAARRADRLLGVDLSYRTLEGVRRMRELCRAQALGRIYAADLVFHNAYGPDKDWFYDRRRSGGGCVIDLGVHLVDLALWLLGNPAVSRVTSRLFAEGKPLGRRAPTVEDYAVATLDLDDGTVVRLACSWRLSAGREAVIEASFYGTEGGLGLRNVNGSFYDFVAEHHVGTRREVLAVPPDSWGGRAIVGWATRLAAGERFDPATDTLLATARAIDAIYGRRVPARARSLA